MSNGRTGCINRDNNAVNNFFNINPFVKILVIVDEDVNPEDPGEVDWAIATRVQSDGDIIVKPDSPGMPIDPSVGADGLVVNLGIDATKPIENKENFEKIDIAEDIEKKVCSIMKKEGY